MKKMMLISIGGLLPENYFSLWEPICFAIN